MLMTNDKIWQNMRQYQDSDKIANGSVTLVLKFTSFWFRKLYNQTLFFSNPVWAPSVYLCLCNCMQVHISSSCLKLPYWVSNFLKVVTTCKHPQDNFAQMSVKTIAPVVKKPVCDLCRTRGGLLNLEEFGAKKGNFWTSLSQLGPPLTHHSTCLANHR